MTASDTQAVPGTALSVLTGQAQSTSWPIFTIVRQHSYSTPVPSPRLNHDVAALRSRPCNQASALPRLRAVGSSGRRRRGIRPTPPRCLPLLASAGPVPVSLPARFGSAAESISPAWRAEALAAI